MTGNSGAGRAGTGVAGVTRLPRRGHRPGRAFHASAEAYIGEAERLLERSRSESAPAERVVWAYRAALRGAGAAIEAAGTVGGGRRRRAAGSAWDRLRAAVPEDADWVDRFELHARFVSRVETGSESGLQDGDADLFYGEVCRFIDHVREQVGYLPEVA